MNPAAILWTFWLLFLLRVVGQIPVMLWRPKWLPPPRQWYSGLIPYGILLPVQVAILVLMVLMILQVHPGAGTLGAPSRTNAGAILAFSVVYFAAMPLRYLFRVHLNPERRWYDTLIPIALHCVLAAFLFTYAWANLTH